MRRLSSLAVAGATLAGTSVVLVAGPAHAVQAECSSIAQTDTPSTEITGASAPYDLLGMTAARDEVGDPPAGQEPVRVAVLDTGVRAIDGKVVVHDTEPVATGDGGLVDGGGTEVAGLVAGADREGAGPVGFAPDAEIVDVQVGAVRVGDSDQVPVTPKNVIAGLKWVAQHAGTDNIKVATVAYAVDADRRLADAVRRAQQAGVVVVVATDDPAYATETGTTEEDQPGPQPDAAADNTLPSLPGVVAVNTTPDGSTAGFVPVPSSDTTVAVPSAGAVTYAFNDHTCRITEPTTSAATAEVAGVVALLWQRFPDDQAAQIVARLINTASGTTDDPTPLTGYGIVQPLAALTRPVDASSDGTVERTENVAGDDGPVSPPTTPTDLLAATRDDAVWWGLIGGGLLVVALLLRPVLARRRGSG